MSQFRGNTGTLIVIVARAKELPNKRKLEKQNPYCLLRISNLTDKTRADLRGGQVPRWDEEFRFNISPEQQPVLKLSVLDETKKAPTLIAEAEIDFTPVFYSSVKEGYDKWHQLTAGSRDAGMIYLEMTFYPAVSGGLGNTMSSSQRKCVTEMPTSSNPSSPKKRSLPPIPGHVVEVEPEVEVDTIPEPLPRIGNRYEQPQSDPFMRSQMSIQSLPDVPVVNNIKKDLPALQTNYDRAESPALVTHHDIVSERVSSSQSWMDYARDLTSKYTAPIFGQRVEETEPVNAFDQLEREVQSDFEKTPRSRQKPPPLPSHSAGSLRMSGSGGSSSLPPPTPSQSGSYDVIEPHREQHPSGRSSPTRKAPPSGQFYRSGATSPARLDLSSIPYDATQIGTTSSPSRSPHRSPVRFGEALRDDGDELMSEHDAPTPSEAFGGSGGRSRMSPTRFKTSLPPRPPPKR